VPATRRFDLDSRLVPVIVVANPPIRAVAESADPVWLSCMFVIF
jgi:hypothetical protein